jgi:dethiobiotin synthetase
MARRCRAVMVAATKQHTGKTSVSMALLSGLRKIFGEDRVGFMKPVGQRFAVMPTGEKVDEDVRMTKEHFGLDHLKWSDMSPVVVDRNYTRRFLDGKEKWEAQARAIQRGFKNLSATNDFVVVEGTGHCGVGSIIGLSNAQVAKLLGVDVLLVANGGLGSTFDELELNRQVR